jgi:hypothetical protein
VGLFLLPQRAAVFHFTTSDENVGSRITQQILSGTLAPFTVTVSSGTGALFANNLPAQPKLVTLALDTETEEGVSSVIEVMELASRSGDTLTISARAQDGTTALTWPVNSKIQIRITALHIAELQSFLGSSRAANLVLAGPSTGSAAAPAWRALAAADIPNIESLNGTATVPKGGTGLATLTSGSIMLGNGTGAVTMLAPGASGNVATSDGAGNWRSSAAPTGTPHAILSATHTDSTASAVVRGGLITGQGSSPTWKQLAIGTVGKHLRSNGTDVLWGYVDLTADVTGALDIPNGGTGLATVALGDILIANADDSLASLAGNTGLIREILFSQGDGTDTTAPFYDTLEAADLPSHNHSGANITSGLVAGSVGGTGIGAYATGDTLYATGTYTLGRLAGNTSTTPKMLLQSGTGVASLAPYWSPISALPTGFPNEDATLIANTNDLSITATAGFVRLDNTTGAGVNLTGVAGGTNGRMVVLMNASSAAADSITIKPEDAGSAAANQFKTHDGSDLIMAQNGTANFIYDATSEKWHFVGGNN